MTWQAWRTFWAWCAGMAVLCLLLATVGPAMGGW
jgi:hypothetical protein